MDKFRAKVDKWRCLVLPKGRRVTLDHAGLNSQHIYFFSFLGALMKAISSMEKMSDFIWKGYIDLAVSC